MTVNSHLLSFLQKVVICASLSICTFACYGSNDHSSHSGHSDVLLEVLHLKIKIVKLQTQYSLESSLTDLSINIRNQSIALDNATHLLQEYVAIPESRYPNLEMYHQSLISRAGLIQEFSVLLKVFHQQLSNTSIK